MATAALSPPNVDDRPRTRVARSTVVCFLIAFAIYGALAIRDRALIGDEPHYLMVARSIVHDRDVDLAGDYTPERTGDLAPSLSWAAHAFEYRDDGRLRPIQGIGFPVVLAPVLAIDDEPGAARLVMALLAAMTAALVWGLLRDLAVGSCTGRLVAWLAVFATLPFVGYVDQIYPEVPAALAIVVAVRLLVPPASVLHLASASAAAGLLLLLHVRFGVLALGITAAAVWRAVHTPAPRAGSTTGPPRTRARVLAAVIPVTVSFVTTAAIARHLYGAWWPTGAYRADTIAHSLDPGNLYPWGVGRLLDPEVGLLPFAPVFLVALVGLPLVVLRWPRAGTVAVGTALAYATTIGLNARISIGPTLGARVLVVLVPLAAVPIALALRDRPVLTGITVVLLAVSVVQAARTLVRPERAYADFITADSPVTLPELWPETVQPRGLRTLALRLDGQPRQTGEVAGRGARAQVEARVGRDRAGYLQFARAPVLAAGPATLTVTLVAPSPAPAGTPIVAIDILRDRREVIARRDIVATGSTTARTEVLRFTSPGGARFEPRIQWPGAADVVLTKVALEVEGEAPGSAPDWPRTVGWAVLVGAGAAWLTRDDLQRRRQDAPETLPASRSRRRSTS